MVVDPADTPATVPDDEPTVADDELLLQVPPADALVSVVLAPTHTLDEPVIADGSGLTEMIFVADAAPHVLVMV